MYRFNIVKTDDNAWRFELDGINMIIDDYQLKDEKHYIKSPGKAIAFFNIKGNIYGIANPFQTCSTAEEFYEVMRSQYAYFQ